MKKITLNVFTIVCLTMVNIVQAQIGIGTASPDLSSVLDIDSSNSGILIPRISLSNNTDTVTIPSPATSLLVYNTGFAPNGYYYWNGTSWSQLAVATASTDWSLLGNAGTTAGSNYLGTSDPVDLRFKTGAIDRWNISDTNNGQLQSYSLGTAAAPSYSFQTDQNTGLYSSGADALDIATGGLGRFRFPNANQVHALSLGTAALPFYSFDADTNTGIFSSGADALDIATAGVARFRFPNANQVHALSLGTAALPFYSFGSDTNTGMFSSAGDFLAFATTGAQRMTIGSTGNVGIGITVPGFTLDVASTGRAINATTSAGTQSAIFGFNISAAGAGIGGYGIGGQTSQSGSVGIRGEQLNAAGDAISGINFATAGAGVGSGIYGQTAQAGGMAIDASNINTSGTGIYSAGQNAPGTYLVAGSGGSFNGVTTGVHARNTSLGVSQAIYSDNGGTICRVNYWSGTTQYKILGTGTVSTTAENVNGERVVLHCTEAPEIYFEDYGQGQLINGRVHINIDPTIAKNITVNEKHPLRVFIQLEDECNGVFVTNKTGSSFDVVELASGQSNAKFQYRIVGNRADEVLPNGRISKNADTRFELAPKDLETKAPATADVGKPTAAK